MSTRKSIEEYIDANHDKLRSFVKSRICNRDPEDVLQSVYLRLFKNDINIHDESYWNYISSAARRESYSLFKRKLKLASETDSRQSFDLIPSEEPKSNSEAKELADLALSSLKSPYLEVARSFYLEGNTIQQISANNKVPVGTIKRQLHHSRKKMKKFMEDLGYVASDVL